MERHDVIVAGAGPVGLSLALGLARAGTDVLVLEKEAVTAEHSRAPAIWPGTQEILAQLGVIERFLEQGIVLRRIEVHDADRGRVLVRIPIEELRDETLYAHLLILPQAQTERLLLQALHEQARARVLFAAEAAGFAQDASKVEVRYRCNGREELAQARFVVGCDGAHSRVREFLGAAFEGMTYSVKAALADVDVEGDNDEPFPRLTTRPDLVIAIRIDRQRWRLILPIASESGHSLDTRVAEAMRALFPSRRYRQVWQSEFRLHNRLSSRFAQGRIVLAGDAAHLNSPVGGQGMNAGIRDAAELTRALHAALEQDSVEPVAAYAARRRGEIEAGVNRFTDQMTRLLLSGRGRMVRPVMRTADMLLRLPPLRRRFLRRVGMLVPRN
ncbi:MAG: NAD(P)/FAD-dependent oxidoreductase [Burkholderiales bacterium]